MRGTLVVSADTESLFGEAARRVAEALSADAQNRQRVTIALAGGNTPRPLYSLLAAEPFRSQIPWEKTHFFWGDERLVPLDHAQSNYKMVHHSLFRHLAVPIGNIHPAPVHLALDEAALEYERQIRNFFGQRRGFPSFDLILLGLGADGHTASLFPYATSLAEDRRIVTVARSPVGAPRITLTLPVLNQAKRVLFLVAGKNKARALQQAVEGAGDLPAQRVFPKNGELVWVADCHAASLLKQVRVEP